MSKQWRNALGGVLLLCAGCGSLLAWAGPAARHDSEPPALPADLKPPAVLVFSKTNGFRHVEAIPAANAALAEMGRRQGWAMVFTENGAVFSPELLRRFQAVVWNNVSGDVLSEPQRAAFRSYMESGGGFVGIHGSGGDARYAWPWYVETLIGAQFTGHPMNPQFQSARLRFENREDFIIRDLPASWETIDEWYSFARSPREAGVQVLATLDENSYLPEMRMAATKRDLRMGTDHPVIWKHCIGSGRAFYSALGHRAESYAEPRYLGLLERAVTWAAGLGGAPCGKTVEPGASPASSP